MNRRRPGTEDATTVHTVRGLEALDALLLPRLDDHAGPARRMSAAKSAAMVSSILDAALVPDALAAPEAGPAPERVVVRAPAPRRRPGRTIALLAAAVVVAATVGAAAAVLVTRQLASPAPATATPAPAPGPDRAPAPSLGPEAEPPPDPEIEMEGTTIRRPAPRPERAPVPTLPDDAPAEDVLALANQQRKDQDWRSADALYRRVMRSFPGTDAAVVAEVASATIHLGHLRDPAGALRSYRHALATRPRGPLAEEARWGIAEAHRAQGEVDGELAALTDFLAVHPGSALAPAARRRRAELSR